jgi:diaminopimelate decarboxylase
MKNRQRIKLLGLHIYIQSNYEEKQRITLTTRTVVTCGERWAVGRQGHEEGFGGASKVLFIDLDGGCVRE